MPGGVRSRQPWLYLGADWAASDILGPEKEREKERKESEEGEGRGGGRGKGGTGGGGRRSGMWEGGSEEREGAELPEEAGGVRCRRRVRDR